MIKKNKIFKDNYCNKNLFVYSILFTMLFVILFILMKLNISTKLDVVINLFFVSIQTNFLVSLFLIITELGSSIFVGIVSIFVAIYLYVNKSFKALKIFISAIVIELGVVYILKHLISRIRPFNTLKTLFSFPSGHAAISIVFLGFISWFFWNKNKFVSYTMWVLILLIGISRLVLNMHWFTDVLAGYAIGLAILSFCVFFYNNYF